MELNGKRALVVGLGKSGVASALFMNAHGARVTVSDTKSGDELRNEIPVLLDHGITVETGCHGERTFRGQDLIVVSPGVPVDAPAGGIAADSLAPRRVGELMFPIAQRYVNDVLLVSDQSIQAAQEKLWSTLRIAAEPGGASALAALLSGLYRPKADERVGVVICGGNTTAANFSENLAPVRLSAGALVHGLH